MKFDTDIGAEIVLVIAEEISGLPRGKAWIKYGKKRIYFNEKEEDIDYSFFVDFSGDHVEVKEFEEGYWLEKIDMESKKELENKIEEIFYQVAYPLEEKFPAYTIREMELHRRFEGALKKETDDKYSIHLLSLELDVDVPKSVISIAQNTERTKAGNPIIRFVIKRDSLDEIIEEFERIEDEADRLFMAELQSSVPQKISIKQDPTEKKGSELIIDEGETKTCLNCHKEFVLYADDTLTEFCSSECKKEYQHESW